MNDYLKDIVQRMMHEEPPNTNSEDSISFKAHREAETLNDPEFLRSAKEAVETEKDKKTRSALYFVISKVALNLNCQDTGEFLIGQLRLEKDKYVLMSLLDRIAEQPKKSSTNLTPIFEFIKDKRWQVRYSAIQSLNNSDSPLAEQALIDILNTSTDPYDITYANATLNRIGTAKAIPSIEQHLKSRKRDVKISAQLAIESIMKRKSGANKRILNP